MQKTDGDPQLSIVIPVYNEEGRIPKSIGQIFSYLETLPISIEVLFVNDGSLDGTQKLLEHLQEQYQFRVVGYQQNKGKGFAVRHGVLHARGAYTVFFDIDLATPLNTFELLLPLITEGSKPVIIGSRRISGSSIDIREPGLRTFLGQGFTLLSRIFVYEVADFTCGFKCFRSDAAKKIFSLARINRWAFDTEILFLAKYCGFTITQIPVHWVHDQDSRVRVFRDVIRSLQDLSLLVFYIATGAYRSPAPRAEELIDHD